VIQELMPAERTSPGYDPAWYRDAVIYQLHVRTFLDSDSDGIGDFRGLAQKLDYLQELGVNALWLLPFYPSPLRDDGYDIADFRGINPIYGTMRDFREFLREAHRRGLRVITELVINHTSDQHPWFQRARAARPGSPYRDFYVWSDNPTGYPDARIIFKDFEPSNWTWDHQAGAYYWHRFYSHQPDLNYDNPRVHEAVFAALDLWLDMGVDGLRLDAIPYLYERQGTSCENLPETHAFLKKLRARVDARYPGRMLLAEANQWPDDAVKYFGDGDECHMCFHFPLMPRLYMALQMENRFPLIDILQQTPAIPDSCQWAIFLRNHDELTLEMVTDEERDYMYRVYAQDPRMRLNMGIRRRLSPLLGNDRPSIELMNGLLLSMPGAPVIYYGDEIGMGDNIFLGDRNGVRTPMQWSADRNAGFSRANPQQLCLPIIIDPQYHYEVYNVEAERNNRSSLLWWMRRLIALRSQYKAFSRGSLTFIEPDNPRVLAFVREHERERILVVVNLSRFTQYVQLDLSQFQGTVPVEVFGSTPFPPVAEDPYFLTLGAHTFLWFELKQPADLERQAPVIEPEQLPVLAVRARADEIFDTDRIGRLERVLPSFLLAQRWYGAKGRTAKRAAVRGVVPLRVDGVTAHVCLVGMDYADGSSESYVLPIMHLPAQAAQQTLKDYPRAAIARVSAGPASPDGYLVDALVREEFARALLALMAGRGRLRGAGVEIRSSPSRDLRRLGRDEAAVIETRPLKAEQSNSSVVYPNRYMLKFFRHLQEGENPELEIGRFLTERGFPNLPHVEGALEIEGADSSPGTLAILQAFVANQGDAWDYSLNSLYEYFDRVWAMPDSQQNAPPAVGTIPDLALGEPGEQIDGLIGYYADSARLLAVRTAEMHRALASDLSDPAFSPEAFSVPYQRSLYQSIRSRVIRVFGEAHKARAGLPQSAQGLLEEVLGRREELLARLRSLIGEKLSGKRLRCHGDYHLGQILFTGKDFVIIDFEGEPARPISERRIKRSPLRDVAGMIRSFHYAAHSALANEESQGSVPADSRPVMESWADYWYVTVGAIFLHHYLAGIRSLGFVPEDPKQLRLLLDALLLEKAVYELGYEINNRPDWVAIPLEGIRHLLRSA
jgi:maltose alpha-D-glucosyltransferase/alpha-amylase